MTDQDVADMFLNYQLHHSVKPFAGINLSLLHKKGKSEWPCWAYWDRNIMGFAASPYNSIRMALVVEEVAKGDRHETGLGSNGTELNPFQWEAVRLNFLGSSDYNPTLAWVSKLRKDCLVACDILTFVDDKQLTGPTRELAWQAGH